jgi:hypothetical protein
MRSHHAFRTAGLALLAAFGLAPMLALTAVPGWAEDCRRSIPAPVPSYSMEVLVDGNPLSAYNARGTTYVEALKGREYSIRLTNRTGERVAVALAVDGLNSIDAKHTSSRDARKWILAPWETVTLSGWQTSSGTARRFVFTSEASSYGSWLGRTSDLGVISAAFFREVRPRVDRMEAPAAPQPLAEGGIGNDSKSDAPRESLSGAMKSRAKEELAATGIGREVEHRVLQVDFDEEDSPASIISVRYEYHEALVRLGVIPAGDDALARRERARGFADSGFAPDPFGSRH